MALNNGILKVEFSKNNRFEIQMQYQKDQGGRAPKARNEIHFFEMIEMTAVPS